MEEMSSEEYTMWLAYHKIDSISSWREDYRAGIIASVIANVNRKKGSKPFSPKDFMPKFGPPVRQKLNVLKRKLLAFAEAFKAKE